MVFTVEHDGDTYNVWVSLEEGNPLIQDESFIIATDRNCNIAMERAQAALLDAALTLAHMRRTGKRSGVVKHG